MFVLYVTFYVTFEVTLYVTLYVTFYLSGGVWGAASPPIISFRGSAA